MIWGAVGQSLGVDAVAIAGTPVVGDTPVAGRGLALAVDTDGRIGVAFRREHEDGLLYAVREPMVQGWSVEAIPLGVTETLGLWPSIGFTSHGEPVLAYVLGEQGDVWLAYRKEGCWGKKAVLVAGAYVYPSILKLSGQNVLLGAMKLGFDPEKHPSHRIQLLESTLPQCP